MKRTPCRHVRGERRQDDHSALPFQVFEVTTFDGPDPDKTIRTISGVLAREVDGMPVMRHALRVAQLWAAATT